MRTIKEQEIILEDLVEKSFELAKVDVKKYEEEALSLEEKLNYNLEDYKNRLKKRLLEFAVCGAEKIRIVRLSVFGDYSDTYSEKYYIDFYKEKLEEAEDYDMLNLRYNYVYLASMNDIFEKMIYVIATGKVEFLELQEVKDINAINKIYEIINDKGNNIDYWLGTERRFKKLEENGIDFELDFPTDENLMYEDDINIENLRDVIEEIDYDSEEEKPKEEDTKEDSEEEKIFRAMFEKFMKEYKM